VFFFFCKNCNQAIFYATMIPRYRCNKLLQAITQVVEHYTSTNTVKLVKIGPRTLTYWKEVNILVQYCKQSLLTAIGSRKKRTERSNETTTQRQPILSCIKNQKLKTLTKQKANKINVHALFGSEKLHKTKSTRSNIASYTKLRKQ